MTCYTAGPWVDREFVKTVRDKLENAGIEVDSKWLDVVVPEGADELEAYKMEQALVDLKGVVSADVLFYVNTGTLSEGKATELGIAMAMLKPIVIIGDRSNNIFLSLNIPCYATVEEFLEYAKQASADC